MTFINGSRIQRAMMDQRGRVLQAQAAFARERRVAGSLLIEGIGRTGVDIVFPVVFVHQPVMVFGQHLDVNENYDTALPPSVDATVSRWVTVERGDPNQLVWTGCRILATTYGRPNQRQILTWMATAVAIDATPGKLGGTKDPI